MGGGQVAVAFESRYVRNGRGAPSELVPPLKAESGTNGKGDGAPLIAISGRARGDDGRGYARPEHMSVDVASALDGVKQDRILPPGAMAVRRLTPLECERLMSWPDNHTLVPYRKGLMADGPRYKMCGNGMVSLVMRWIGQRMEAVDRIPRA